MYRRNVSEGALLCLPLFLAIALMLSACSENDEGPDVEKGCGLGDEVLIGWVASEVNQREVMESSARHLQLNEWLWGLPYGDVVIQRVPIDFKGALSKAIAARMLEVAGGVDGDGLLDAFQGIPIQGPPYLDTWDMSSMRLSKSGKPMRRVAGAYRIDVDLNDGSIVFPNPTRDEVLWEVDSESSRGIVQFSHPIFHPSRAVAAVFVSVRHDSSLTVGLLVLRDSGAWRVVAEDFLAF